MWGWRAFTPLSITATRTTRPVREGNGRLSLSSGFDGCWEVICHCTVEENLILTSTYCLQVKSAKSIVEIRVAISLMCAPFHTLLQRCQFRLPPCARVARLIKVSA